ncbi:hypothetical protein KKF84_04590, partial [Myxococcota bacterium]|nr:hypothetical protein [Myxococcota bacterium]MBU1534574.1 hypothetical protein [Myxococcota bacterium]
MRTLLYPLVVIAMLSCSGTSPDSNTVPSGDETRPASSDTTETTMGNRPSSSTLTDGTQSAGAMAGDDSGEKNTKPATPLKKTKKRPEDLIIRSGSALTVKEAKAILAYHNLVRRHVKAGLQYWDTKVAAYSQLWANNLGARGCLLEHRKKNLYGENLWAGTASAYPVVSAAKSWETEKKYYTGGKLSPKNWYKSGHYTQMVWRSSTALGCGKFVCKNGMMVVVCNYNPSGNWMGQKP